MTVKASAHYPNLIHYQLYPFTATAISAETYTSTSANHNSSISHMQLIPRCNSSQLQFIPCGNHPSDNSSQLQLIPTATHPRCNSLSCNSSIAAFHLICNLSQLQLILYNSSLLQLIPSATPTPLLHPTSR